MHTYMQLNLYAYNYVYKYKNLYTSINLILNQIHGCNSLINANVRKASTCTSMWIYIHIVCMYIKNMSMIHCV